MHTLAISRRLMLAITALMMLGVIANDATIPVVPQIASGLGIELGYAQFMITAFIAGYSLGQLPCGILADRVGRLPVLYGGLVLFCIAGSICTIVDQYESLLLARFAQGLGASAGAVLSRTICRDLRSGIELAKLMSLLGTALSSAGVLAPMMGGLITGLWGWNALFIAFLAQGVITALTTYLWVPETHPQKRANSPSRAAPLPLKHCAKLFFSSAQSVWATAILAIAFFGFMSILGMFGTIAIDIYKVPAEQAGPWLSGGIAFFVVATLTVHRLLAHVGPLQVLKCALFLFLMSASAFIVLLNQSHTDFIWFWLCSLPYFTGLGLLFPVISSIALSPLPSVAGLASSILGTMQTFFAFMASLLTALTYNGEIETSVLPLLAAVAVILVLFLRRPSIQI